MPSSGEHSVDIVFLGDNDYMQSQFSYFINISINLGSSDYYFSKEGFAYSKTKIFLT